MYVRLVPHWNVSVDKGSAVGLRTSHPKGGIFVIDILSGDHLGVTRRTQELRFVDVLHLLACLVIPRESFCINPHALGKIG